MENLRNKIRKISRENEILGITPLDNDPIICIFLGDDSSSEYEKDICNLMEDTLKSPPKNKSIIYKTFTSFEAKIEDVLIEAGDYFRKARLFDSVNNKINLFFISEIHGDIWNNKSNIDEFVGTLSDIKAKFMKLGIFINVYYMSPVDLLKAAIHKIDCKDSSKYFAYCMVKYLDATVYHIPTQVKDLDSYPISKTLAFIILVLSTKQHFDIIKFDKYDDNGNYSWITARLFEIDYMDMAFNYICRKMLQAQGDDRSIGSNVEEPDVAGIVNNIFSKYTELNVTDADSYVPIPVVHSKIEKKQGILDKIMHKNIEYESIYRLKRSEIPEYISKLAEKYFEKIGQSMDDLFLDEQLDNFINQIIKSCKYFYQLGEVKDYMKKAKSYFNNLDKETHQERSMYLKKILSCVYSMKIKFLDKAIERFEERYDVYSKETANVSIRINDKLKRLVPDIDINDIFESFECGTMNLACSEDELIETVKGYRDNLKSHIRTSGKIAVIKSKYEALIENNITVIKNFGAIGIDDTNDKLKWYLGSDDGGAKQPEIIDKNIYRETVGSLMFTHPVPYSFCEKLPY